MLPKSNYQLTIRYGYESIMKLIVLLKSFKIPSFAEAEGVIEDVDWSSWSADVMLPKSNYQLTIIYTAYIKWN